SSMQRCSASSAGSTATKALSAISGGLAKRALCTGRYRSAMKRLAAATSVIPASFSSLGKRSCKVANIRSDRPRAWGRIGGDMLDAEPVERAADLGEVGSVHLAAGPGRVEVVAAAVGVEAAGQAAGREGLHQRAEARGGPLLGDEEGRVNLAR